MAVWNNLYFLRHKSVTWASVLSGLVDWMWQVMATLPTEIVHTCKSWMSVMSSPHSLSMSSRNYSTLTLLGAPSIITTMTSLATGMVMHVMTRAKTKT